MRSSVVVVALIILASWSGSWARHSRGRRHGHGRVVITVRVIVDPAGSCRCSHVVCVVVLVEMITVAMIPVILVPILVVKCSKVKTGQPAFCHARPPVLKLKWGQDGSVPRSWSVRHGCLCGCLQPINRDAGDMAPW